MDIPSRSLSELHAVCRFLSDFSGRWWLGGGWAIDAWLGEQSRDHEDIEICIARHDQEQVFTYCATWQFLTPVNDQWTPLPAGERLRPPQFMLQLQQAPQTLGADDDMPPTFEFLLNDVQDDMWTFSRLPQLQSPIMDVFSRSPWGMNATRPELILLHKAVYQPRPKDELDFQRILPYLSPAQQRWLRAHISAMHADDHPWIARLAAIE
jgi:hypothetical protein